MLSFAEAGISNPTSVPNGASSFARRTDNDEKTNYGFLWPSKDLITKAKRIIIATDDDEPGEKLANELARRIGRHKCYRIFYPEGCKDANDVLLKKGKQALAECFDNAEPWPVAGLYEASRYFSEVDDLFQNGYGDKVLTGLDPVDELECARPGGLHDLRRRRQDSGVLLAASRSSHAGRYEVMLRARSRRARVVAHGVRREDGQ